MDASAQLSQSITAANEFSKLFYETFDKRRQAIIKLYQDKASLVWEGNAISGLDSIHKFFEGLPTSTHLIEGLDAQPIIIGTLDADNSNSIMVTVFGKVKFEGTDAEAFTQTFILNAADNKWKIISDTFRFMK